MRTLAKLDMYDYLLLPGVIQVKIDHTADPILVDILSDIANSDGYIYVEGEYYNFLDDYKIVSQGDNNYLELSVVSMNNMTRGDESFV